MGSASLIASAIALILLLITAYVIVGGTLSAAEIIVFAQHEQVAQQETRMRTSIEIVGATLTGGASPLIVEVHNTGQEPVSGFDHMEAYLVFADEPLLHPYGTGAGYWSYGGITPDSIHPHQLDPDEVLTMSVAYSGVTAPVWVQVTTDRGVYDSAYI
jgi:flagellar protein FlaF